MSHEDKTRVSSLFGQPRAKVEAELSEREEVRCPLCDLEPLPFAVDNQGFCLTRCPSCGLEFLSPRPLFSQLAAKVYGLGYNPTEVIPPSGVHAHLERQFRRLEELLERGGSLLDVGCGSGTFLRLAAERGWQANGTDIHLDPAAEGSGARLWRGRLGEIDFGQERFDVVRFHHVLEHTQNPLDELRRAHGLLSDGGVLLLSVPNLAGLSPRLKSWQSRLGLKTHRWRHYAALHHLWYFTPRTLHRLVEAAQFTVIHWETPIPVKPGQPDWWSALLRVLLEGPRWGGILDFYCRLR